MAKIIACPSASASSPSNAEKLDNAHTHNISAIPLNSASDQTLIFENIFPNLFSFQLVLQQQIINPTWTHTKFNIIVTSVPRGPIITNDSVQNTWAQTSATSAHSCCEPFSVSLSPSLFHSQFQISETLSIHQRCRIFRHVILTVRGPSQWHFSYDFRMVTFFLVSAWAGYSMNSFLYN